MTQLAYKAGHRGVTVLVVNRGSPRSKTCSTWRHNVWKMPLCVRE
jgi:transposase